MRNCNSCRWHKIFIDELSNGELRNDGCTCLKDRTPGTGWQTQHIRSCNGDECFMWEDNLNKVTCIIRY